MSIYENFEPVRQIAAHELVLEQIRSAMEAGQFRPGDRLPSERELADMLHVSRTVVRTAIAVLEGEGRIMVRRGRAGGFIVQSPNVDPAATRRIIREHRTAIEDAIEFRLILEGSAARLAAERRRKNDVAKLRRLLRAMDAAFAVCMEDQNPHNVAEFETLDAEFHQAIAAATRINMLAECVVSTRRKLWAPVGGIFWRLEANAHRMHEAITHGVEVQDGDAAELAMRQHIADTRESIELWLRRR